MSILDEAQKIIYGDREQTYGDPAKNLRTIGDLWTTYLGLPVGGIKPEDVANMMVLLKVARLRNTPTHYDSLVDIAGYAALVERIHHLGPSVPVQGDDMNAPTVVVQPDRTGLCRDEPEDDPMVEIPIFGQRPEPSFHGDALDSPERSGIREEPAEASFYVDEA